MNYLTDIIVYGIIYVTGYKNFTDINFKGENMNISIKEIAKKAGVSKATVSRVLNKKENVKKETEQKVLKIMNDLGYVPDERARNLSLGINNNIAIIVPSDNPIYINIIQKINKKLFNLNMSLLFYITNHNPEVENELLNKLKSKSLGGLIYIKSPETNFDNTDDLDKLNIPIVLVVDEDINSGYDQINYSEKEISAKCVELLINEKHQKIAYLCTPLNLQYEKKRYEGIIDTLIRFDKEINMTNFYFVNDVTIEDAYQITKNILTDNNYTAIYSSSNILAMGALKAFKEENLKLGKDISLVSHGDLDAYNKIGYNITTVSISSQKITELSVDLLLERIKNNNKKIEKVDLNIAPEINGSEKITK